MITTSTSATSTTTPTHTTGGGGYHRWGGEGGGPPPNTEPYINHEINQSSWAHLPLHWHIFHSKAPLQLPTSSSPSSAATCRCFGPRRWWSRDAGKVDAPIVGGLWRATRCGWLVKGAERDEKMMKTWNMYIQRIKSGKLFNTKWTKRKVEFEEMRLTWVWFFDLQWIIGDAVRTFR